MRRGSHARTTDAGVGGSVLRGLRGLRAGVRVALSQPSDATVTRSPGDESAERVSEAATVDGDDPPDSRVLYGAIGADVICRDGVCIGDLIEVASDHIEVERGLLDVSFLDLPIWSVASFDGERVVLRMTCREALRRNWVPQ